MRKTKYSFLISAAVMASLVLSCQAAQADDNAAPVTNAQSTAAATTTPAEKQPPKVVSTKVDGEPDVNTTGIEVFDPVQVTVKTDHFTNDNLLTKDGLGWTEDTEVIPIRGHAVGIINEGTYWGKENPSEPVTAYSFNQGDSGRITYIGKTLSRIDLDLIYTIKNTDADIWNAYSGMGHRRFTKGIAFTGQQYIPGSDNNSIVVLYRGANSIQIDYQIVKHDTFEEMPILVSFITTDIDVGQGVATNLANLAAVFPSETNLNIQDGIVYDDSQTGINLNGDRDLPYGGYLGVAFLSNFTYAFFSPAPANTNLYQFAAGVRYDLFGSALQTKLIINRQTHLTLKYVDDEGKELRPATELKGTNDFPVVPDAPTIDRYVLRETSTNIISPDQEVITYTYLPKYLVTVETVDEQGQQLAEPQKIDTYKGALLRLQPNQVPGYQTPTEQTVVVGSDQTVRFVYKRIPAPQPSQRYASGWTAGYAATGNYRAQPAVYRPASSWQGGSAHPLYQLPRVNVNIYLPRKHVNKQVRKKQRTDWFQKNTGFNKEQQKVFFKVLKAIENEGKRRGHSKETIYRDQLYFIGAAAGYKQSKLQTNTSRVSNYDINSYLKGKLSRKTLDNFGSIIRDNHKGSNKIDIGHMAITAASSLDKSKHVKWIQGIANAPLIEAGFFADKIWSLFNKNPFNSPVKRWAFINGYYGDMLTNMSKSDFRADTDVFHILNSKRSLSATLKTRYNQPTGALDAQRRKLGKQLSQQSVRSLTTVKAATVGLVMLTAAAIFKDAAVATWKQLKQFGKNPRAFFSPMFNTIQRNIVQPIGRFYHRTVAVVRQTPSMVRHAAQKVGSFYHRATRWVSSGVRHTVQRARNFYHRTVSAVRRGFSRARRFVRRIFRRRR